MLAKQLNLIEADLNRAVMSLQKHYVYTGTTGQYSWPVESRVYELFTESTESEIEFMLHKMAPELEMVELTQKNFTVKLKNY